MRNFQIISNYIKSNSMKKKNVITMNTNLFEYFEGRIQFKRQLNSDSTADLYRATNNWLKRYTKENELLLGKVTQQFVVEFVAFLGTKGLKPNSIFTYLSNFRAMYNSAVDECKKKIVEKPFANINIKPHETNKRALSKKIMEKIVKLNLSDKPELELALDLSLFCFLAFGMAFVDLAHLKADNIKDGEIIYNRQKTGVEIRIGITPAMKQLIDKYKNHEGPYLFPILMEEEVPHETYKSLLREQNESLHEIGEMVGLTSVLTTYRFRHTWASEALICGVSIAVIMQALGHTSEKTTRFYLAKLNQTVMNEANELITKSVEELLTKAA